MKKLIPCLLFINACFPWESERRYPTWERTTPGVQAIADCAEADAWVSKSGKEGMGVTLELRGRSSTPCAVTIASARLKIGGVEHVAKQLPEAPILRLGQHVHAYLAFAFDGDAAWNEGAEGELAVAGPTGTAVFRLKQTMQDRQECEPGR